MANILRNEDGSVVKYAWPGGYPVYYVADDGEAICANCVQNEAGYIHEGGDADGWRIDGYDVNWEDDSLFCANCNGRIESAYGEGE